VQWNGFSVGGLPAMAAYAADQLHARKVVVVYPELPGTGDFVGGLTRSVLQAKGVPDVRMLGSDITQPDKTATMSAAAQSDPDAILAVDAGAGCVSLMKAHADLASQTALLVTGNCTEAGFRKAAGSAAEGVYTSNGTLIDSAPDDPDVVVFRQALAAYAPRDIPVTEVTAAGFNTVMNVYNALKNLPADQLTSAKLLQTLKSAKNAPNFLAHPYTCDSRVRLAPSVCNTTSRMLQVKNGKLVDVGGDWLDAAQYVP
jgi:branched-chain amino acid transport system substrate-binding protein